MVFELGVGLEVDRALFADGHLFAVLSDDADHAKHGRADGAGMGKPLFAVAVHEAVAFGAGVVLVDDRPPPVDHLALDLDRARRAAANADLE